MPGNKNVHNSKRNKQDEFYTSLSLIENELKYYKNHFKNKIVLCNCDDPRVSNFFRYFVMFFEVLELKKVIATCYKNNNADLFTEESTEKAVYLEYDGSIKYTCEEDFSKIPCKELNGNGDFRSPECIDFLKTADIVVTNPPFSLFREYISQLIKYNKSFLILGNMNAIFYSEIFPLIKNNLMWLGNNSGHFWFQVPDYYEEKKTDFKIKNGIKYRRMGNICWFTNLDIEKRHEILETGKKYNINEYPEYDNYKAINVNKTLDIPMDYNGIMGVPITFLAKHNPEQFRIIGETHISDTSEEVEALRIDPNHRHGGFIKGKSIYARILIQKIGK